MRAPGELPSAWLMAAVDRLLPSAHHTLLLRSCLDAENGVGAWSEWRASHDLQMALANDRVGMKGLLPLLAFALEHNGATLAANDLSLLRMARYRETLRSERFHAILQQLLSTLAAGEIPCIALKGAALANTVYPEPALRHCHDIDLLIKPNDLARAVNLLLRQKFRFSSQHTPLANALARGDLQLNHDSGLPIALHTKLFRSEFYGMPLAEAWQSATVRGDAMPVPMLAPEWQLLHIVGAVLCSPKRARITWVCDAHLLLVANPAMDWARVCSLAAQSHLALAAYHLLGYLHAQHQSPIPSFVFDQLRQNFTEGFFAGTSRLDFEQLLHSARTQSVVRYTDLLASVSGWQERAFLLRWILFPLPPAAQRQALQGWHLPIFYLRRGLRYLRRQAFAGKPSTG